MTFLEAAGSEFPDYHKQSRKLVIYDKEKRIKLIFEKTADLAHYVDKLAADVGIVIKATIMEDKPDVYELLDFGLGTCTLTVARSPEQHIGLDKKLTNPTKYPTITEAFYLEKRQRVETI